MAKKWTSNKKVWQKIKKNIKKDNKHVAEVGFFDKVYKTEKNFGIPVAYIAMINNEGVGVPARDFMYFSDKEFRKGKVFMSLATTLMGEVANGKITKKDALNNWGYVYQEVIEKSIVDWSIPPNSRETEKLKGKNDPLRETDTMLNSVDVRLKRKGG